ncbi:MAG TPA: GMC family oxidoreductase [Leptolyngbyaceae cyanobacterium]
MLIDARLSELQSITKDVCIIGSGPAGISLARELINQDIQVCLLESGGPYPDAQIQELADGFSMGEPIHPPIDVCTRQLGGNSNAWVIKIGNDQIGVRYAPLDEIDFEKRDWMPNSGWPFDKSHLNSYYERAQEVCQTGPFAYRPDSWENNQAKRLPLDEDRIETAMFEFGPRKAFFQQYKEEIVGSKNITIYSNATVVEIEANEACKTATRVRVACLSGKQFWVSAKVFVLACGGFENARLLLMSNQQHTAGLGNQHDVVGRYFNDHPIVYGGQFVPADPDLFNKTALYDLRRINGFPAMGYIKPSQKALRREELLNLSAIFFPRPSQRQADAVESFKHLAKSALGKQFPQELPSHLLKTFLGLDYVTKAVYLAATKKQPLMPGLHQGGWSKLPKNQNRFESFEIIHQIEQSPEPSNRVMLSRERDILGCPKLEVHWRWSQDDAERIRRGQLLIAKELYRAGLGNFHVEHEDGIPKIGCPSGSHHLIGTTRMHNNPNQGVVDADCRVHGLSNLYIAGSSVFPTGGYANPTLTIVALSLRLGDLLKQEFAKKSLALNLSET